MPPLAILNWLTPKGTGEYVRHNMLVCEESLAALRNQRSGASGPGSQYIIVQKMISDGLHGSWNEGSEKGFVLVVNQCPSGRMLSSVKARSPVGESANAHDNVRVRLANVSMGDDCIGGASSRQVLVSKSDGT